MENEVGDLQEKTVDMADAYDSVQSNTQDASPEHMEAETPIVHDVENELSTEPNTQVCFSMLLLCYY